MNPRRPRTGIRRDGGIRRINSEDVRYPGTDLPGFDASQADSGLRPARDTGIEVEGPRQREHRLRANRERLQMAIGGVVVVVLALLALGWQRSSDIRAAQQPLPVTAVATPEAAHASPGTDPAVPKVAPTREPTPVFATYGKLKIHLPVSVEDLTEVGFHQASYAYAHKMKCPCPDADMDAVKKAKSSKRDKASQESGEDAVLTGVVLRMWRNRPGKPDTSADVGADPGSDVYAPVTGTVVKAVPFKLYEKYKDFEIHIQPTGRPDLDMVLIHVSDPSVKAGDKVVAGVTRIAAIRKINKSIRPQLRQFTKNDGYHTHIQLNDTTYKGYKTKSLKGAITVDDQGNPVTE